MAAGTLSVTNNSKAVVGVGTTFTAFQAGDFLTLVVGQVPYTVAIASIESETALTLVLPFDGPTATGLAWDGVKRDTMSLATMGVTVQAQKALRLMIADENNWRAIFGDAEEVTVTLPNGQVMQGMSWGYLSQLMKQIDPVEMRNLQQQAAASEAAAQGFRNEAEGFKTETAGIRDATNQIKADTQAIHDATNTIKTQTDQLKSDTQAIKDQTNQIKTDTGVIRDEANTAKTDAQSARDAALGYRNEAEQFKNEIDPSKFLAKSNNLSDVADKAQGRANMGLGPTDAVEFGGATLNGSSRVNGTLLLGRQQWDGSSWGSYGLESSLVVMSPDGISEPGFYIRPLSGAQGYATSFTYNLAINLFSTGARIRAVNFSSSTTTMGYSEMWSRACFQGQPYDAEAGVENYQSLVAGTCGTIGQGFYGGVAFGMMTSGGAGWPVGQISIGTQDRAADGTIGLQMHFRFHASGNITYTGPEGSGSFQQIPASDRNIKHDIKDDKSSTAYDNIRAIRFRNFVFNDDEQERIRRGVIAQELEEIDPLYVKHREYHNMELNGPKITRLELDTTPLLLDTMRALQDTIKQVEELKAEIAALKQAEELKK